MKLKFVSLALANLFVLAILAFVPGTAVAQESELQVVDEVIAQINDDVITLVDAQARIERAHRSTAASRHV